MHGSGRGTVNICLVRYEDWLAFNHVMETENAYEFHRDHEPEYQIREGVESWMRYDVWNLEAEMKDIQRLADNTIEANAYFSKYGTAGRQVEQLDWPLFYGWTDPSPRNSAFGGTCFTSIEQDPQMLVMPCDSEGEPEQQDYARREAFLRARQRIREFARIAHTELRPELKLPGVDPDSWFEDRYYKWYDNTEEERRLKKVPDRAKPREKVWSGPGSKKAPLVKPEVIERMSNFRDTGSSSDEVFESAFQNQLARRRAATRKGRS